MSWAQNNSLLVLFALFSLAQQGPVAQFPPTPIRSAFHCFSFRFPFQNPNPRSEVAMMNQQHYGEATIDYRYFNLWDNKLCSLFAQLGQGRSGSSDFNFDKEH
jgi:hypothetical protein